MHRLVGRFCRRKERPDRLSTSADVLGSRRLCWILGLALVFGAVFAGPSLAQEAPATSSILPRPQDRLREQILPAVPFAQDEAILPEIPRPSLGEIQGDDPAAAILVREVVFRGNTVLSEAELRNSVEDLIGRPLAVEGLEALRRRVTEAYVSAGYVNSGALIPKQSLAAGRLEVQIIEGRVEQIRLEGLEHYREPVLRKRIRRGLKAPLNVQEVEAQLRLLDQDPRIARVNAKLRPGSSRSDAILEIRIVEERRSQLRIAFDNDESPAVGAYAGRLSVRNRNVFGFGDEFGVRLTKTEGLTRISGGYELPLNAWGTRLFFDGSYGDAELLENLIDGEKIETSDASAGLGLVQSLWRTPANQVDFSVLFEHRRSKTLQGGERISFTPGPEAGVSKVSAVRVGGDWIYRGARSVFALRSLASFGTDLGHPTVARGINSNGVEVFNGDYPDGIFVSWFGQARGVYRFDRTGIETRLRADVQLSDRPLLPLEQFAIGGAGSVRGFRRNQLVRDQGVSAALDVYVPVLRAADSRPVLAVTPFVDVGGVWDRGRGAARSETLTGAGLGLEWRPHPRLSFGIEWAHGFDSTDTSGDLQDDSVYLRAEWRAFE